MKPPKALHLVEFSRGCLYLWCLIAVLRDRLIKMCVVCDWNKLLKGYALFKKTNVEVSWMLKENVNKSYMKLL